MHARCVSVGVFFLVPLKASMEKIDALRSREILGAAAERLLPWLKFITQEGTVKVEIIRKKSTVIGDHNMLWSLTSNLNVSCWNRI